MTTYPFITTGTGNFQFNPTLDGQTYVAICTWNVYAPRYYINIYDNFGNLIVTNPVIGSPDNFDINLIFGYFQTSTLVYRVSTGNFEVSP
jgi:hypothetical protein